MDRATLDHRSFFIGWVVLLVLWVFLSYVAGVPEYLLASPRRVIAYIQANRDTLGAAVWLTGTQAAVGWLAAVVLGLVSGTFLFQISWVRRAMLPVVIATQTTPIIALAPLITLWFGYGWLSKAVISCVVAIFPIIMATYSGLADAKPTYIHIYKLAGANELSIFWNVRLKCAWSALIPALKTSVVLAVIGSVVAEFMGGNRGLGFLIMVATYGTKSDILLTSVILSALLGQVFLMVLELATKPFEKRFGQAH
jgi:ABC-type nitrate/sulfonate/bicarbonate transport system permease component